MIFWVCRNDKDIQSVLLALLDELIDTVYKWLDDDNKINFFLKDLFDKLNIKDFTFSKCVSIAEFPIPTTKDNYNKISKFVMEYPQKIVDSIDGFDGFIIIIDEFQCLKKLKKPDSFFLVNEKLQSIPA